MSRLGELVLRRRIIGDFLWLDAIVAARALPCHATVVSPGSWVSAPPLLLLPCISLYHLELAPFLELAPCPPGTLLHVLWRLFRAGHAHLELALAKLT
jgi:hypothetical protein